MDERSRAKRQRIIEKLNAMDPGPNMADREKAEDTERDLDRKIEAERARGFTLAQIGRSLFGVGPFG